MTLKKNKCIVVGSGQFCNFIIQIIEDIKEIDCIGYLSENRKKNNKIKKIKCLGDDTYLLNKKNFYDSVFPAIGNLKIRKKIIAKILKYKKPITSIKHPSAIQSKTANFKRHDIVVSKCLFFLFHFSYFHGKSFNISFYSPTSNNSFITNNFR